MKVGRMARMPIPGSDDNVWGSVLNDFLSQVHDSQGLLKANSVGTAQIQDNAITSSQLDTTALTKADVGLGNVDNTSDASKPVSTAVQVALDTKEPAITTGTSTQYYRGDKTFQPLNQDAVPDGTTNKAYTATEKARLANTTGTNTGDQDLSGYVPTSRTINGHALNTDISITKTDVGLANVDNTSDADKPVSTATQTALGLKANTADLGAKILLIDNVSSLPAGTPAGVIVVVKS
jgi:hypothetical protein